MNMTGQDWEVTQEDLDYAQSQYFSEPTIDQILATGAEAAVELFAKEGVEPTEEAVSEWVSKNWAKLSAGMAQGVQLAVNK